MINQLRLPPFIATLATMAGLRSLAAILSGNKAINVPFEWYRVFGSNPWWTLVLFAAVAAVTSVMMGATVLGRHLFALGGNEMAARLSGLPTRRLKAVAYGLSGMLAALGGVLFTGRSGQADPRLGVTYELYAITAAVVGGCSLSGGVGSIRGTVLGLFLIQIVIKGTAIIVRGIDSSQIEGLVLGTCGGAGRRVQPAPPGSRAVHRGSPSRSERRRWPTAPVPTRRACGAAARCGAILWWGSRRSWRCSGWG